MAPKALPCLSSARNEDRVGSHQSAWSPAGERAGIFKNSESRRMRFFALTWHSSESFVITLHLRNSKVLRDCAAALSFGLRGFHTLRSFREMAPLESISARGTSTNPRAFPERSSAETLVSAMTDENDVCCEKRGQGTRCSLSTASEDTLMLLRDAGFTPLDVWIRSISKLQAEMGRCAVEK